MATLKDYFLVVVSLKRAMVFIINLMVLVFVLPSVFVEVSAEGSGRAVPYVAAETYQISDANVTSLVMLVIVNSSVYAGITDSLVQYKADVIDRAGFENVIVLNWSEPDPELIRGTLQQFYLNSSLAGVLFVGDLPAVDYEMFTEWDYERFPMDLYYTDLDGNWSDVDRDGVLDKHTGKVAPEIWLGRIKASNLGEDEVSLINNYFDKVHRYRIGALSSPNRALMYVDDDWKDYATMDNYSVGLLYNDVTAVWDRRTTNIDDFKGRLSEGYEWVHVRAHGSWDQLGFLVPGESGGTISSMAFKGINPSALFYQLFVCSSARFTEPNYLAGEVVFNTDQGLLAISSTKLGGMLMYWTFYDLLAEGRNVGDAFKEWFVKWGEGKVSVSSNWIGRKWFYGLTIIGDPTLRLRWLGPTEIADLQRKEEEVIDELPLVLDLMTQIEGAKANYTYLNGKYSDLQGSYSSLQFTYGNVEIQLADIRNLLYFFLVVTTLLAVSNVYLVKSRPRPKGPAVEAEEGFNF
jgi:hypothetical protein